VTELHRKQVKTVNFIITEAVGQFSKKLFLKNGTFNNSRIFGLNFTMKIIFCTLLFIIKVNFICIAIQAQCFTGKFSINKQVMLLVTALINAKK